MYVCYADSEDRSYAQQYNLITKQLTAKFYD